MTWRLPERLPRPKHPIDPRDLNEAVRTFYDMQTDLNEHNVRTTLSSQLTEADLEDDIAHRYVYLDEINKYRFAYSTEQAAGGVLPEAQDFQAVAAWETSDHLQVDVSSEGGWFLVFLNAPYFNDTDQSDASCWNFCLQVDDSPIAETYVGNFDYGDEVAHSERGPYGYRNNVMYLAPVYVPPGPHTISLGVQLKMILGASTVATANGSVLGGEMYVVELAR
jgi:hypothetical protein